MPGLVVDLFAGGGGASLGLEWAGFPIDIAINHDLEAITVHKVNHPHTRHFCENIRDVDPVAATKGQPVSILWASPDCKHFSKAKGAALVDRNIRSLAWVVVKWAKLTRPRVILLENVEEFVSWGPVVAGRPDPRRKGLIFNAWKKALENLGYEVDHRELRACDYGAPTIRKRLFVVARCDDEPIVWPEPTQGPGPGLEPYRTAAECIDWSIPCPSIFERKKPLAENTLRRIAKGIQKFVIDASEPFVLNLTHGGRLEPLNEPLRTVTGANRGEKALVTPFLARHFGQSIGSNCQDPAPTTTAGGQGKTALVSAFLTKHFGTTVAQGANDPLHTITGKTKHGLVTAFMAQHNGGKVGRKVDAPLSTLVSRGTQQQLVTSHLMKLRGTCRHGQQLDLPFPTLTAGGNHVAEVRAFLIKYYSSNVGHSLKEPFHTVTTKPRFGLVTIHGEAYEIIDIGMRMLSPRELYRAQGFPDSYVIDPIFNGKPLTKTSQVRLCGNSVPPDFAEALARANCAEMEKRVIKRKA